MTERLAGERVAGTVRKETPVGATPLEFTVDTSYNTFTAEYVVKGQHLVFHFFPPYDLDPNSAAFSEYWTCTFPRALSDTAESFFAATYPRLIASHTEELNAWWFEARNFADHHDPEGLCRQFIEKLDSALPPACGIQ